MLINAAGPLVDKHTTLSGESTEHHHFFSKGVHLIVDHITNSQRVLTFFASDGRLFFIMPMGRKTCLGTTDTQVESPCTAVTDAGRQFILDNVNRLLDLPVSLTLKDIIAERCGVRPLAIKGRGGKADWVKLSRKHAVDVNSATRHVSIFGGKLTDCINVGNEIADIVAELGIPLSHADTVWYGEDDKEMDSEYLRRAACDVRRATARHWNYWKKSV